MKVKVTNLSAEVLNKAWLSWLEDESKRASLTDRERYGLTRKYTYGDFYFSRKSNKAQRFEQWLFKHGAEVRQAAGKLHLEFTDETTATMFALKWA